MEPFFFLTLHSHIFFLLKSFLDSTIFEKSVSSAIQLSKGQIGCCSSKVCKVNSNRDSKNCEYYFETF